MQNISAAIGRIVDVSKMYVGSRTATVNAGLADCFKTTKAMVHAIHVMVLIFTSLWNKKADIVVLQNLYYAISARWFSPRQELFSKIVENALPSCKQGEDLVIPSSPILGFTSHFRI